jgi:dihydroorotase
MPPTCSARCGERIERDARVRVLPIGCVTRGRAGKELAELAELAAGGCVALSDDGNPVANARLMRNAMELAAAMGACRSLSIATSQS